MYPRNDLIIIDEQGIRYSTTYGLKFI